MDCTGAKATKSSMGAPKTISNGTANTGPSNPPGNPDQLIGKPDVTIL
ncbi:hypothetical protein [Aliifodinibius salipaludis]|nr:hypothetical protein [Aliifodinibius salipaludis]